MYKLDGHKVHFNVAYMILLQMINRYKKGYMFYGLILTKVFEHFKLNVNTLPYFPVEGTISEKTNRVAIPLTGLPPPPNFINLDPTPTIVPSVGSSQDMFGDKFAKLQVTMSLQKEIETPVIAQSGGTDMMGAGSVDMETGLVNDSVSAPSGIENLD
ncbi:hypothetical protein AgCh_013307 [Apium graveolens]